MATTKSQPAERTASQQNASVTEFLARLDHPSKPEILAIRKIILGAHPDIGESIRWNAPSFRTSEFFATFQLRAKGCVQLIFHFGAKARELPPEALYVPDPTHLLHWLAKDRASVEFRDMKDISAKRTALKGVVREWIKHVSPDAGGDDAAGST